MLLDEHTSISVYMDSGDCYRCHSLRILLAEKQIHYKPVLIADRKKLPEDLLEVNSAGLLPTLIDRQLCITDIQIMSEYLDERFPYPPLMPIDPVGRARTRQGLMYIDNRWGALIKKMQVETGAKLRRTRNALAEEIESNVGLFSKNYIKSNEFGLLDCWVAPILWRLPSMGVKLNEKQVRPIISYQRRIFSSVRFRKSMIDADLSLIDNVA